MGVDKVMVKVEIPSYGNLQLEHLVLDYNGTLAEDGQLLRGVAERLVALSTHLSIHILTADTFGLAQEACRPLPVTLKIVPAEAGARAKEEFVLALGPEKVVAIGNGRNDVAMLRRAALGLAVLGPEGAAGETIAAAKIVVKDIRQGLDLLLHPKRLVATLRG